MSENNKPRVAVVEDEEMLRFAIKKKMENNGIETLEFSTAASALESLKNQDYLPDLIWLDYYLEDMNGIEFMNRLKEDQRLSKIPVVVVSNSASDEKVSAMVALGIKKYFLKADHKLEEMIDEVKRIIKDGE